MSKKILSVGVAALLCSGASAFAMTHHHNEEDKMGLLVTGSLGVGSAYKSNAYLYNMQESKSATDKLSNIDVPFPDSVSKYPYGFGGNIEATYQLVPNMGIGLSFGYIYEMAAKPAASYKTQTTEGTSEVKFSMATLGLNARFCTHLTDSFSVAFLAGPTLDWTKISNAADVTYQWAAATAKDAATIATPRVATLPTNTSRTFESALGMQAGADVMFHMDSGFVIGLSYKYHLATFKATLKDAADGAVNDDTKPNVSGNGELRLTGTHYVGITAGMAF